MAETIACALLANCIPLEVKEASHKRENESRITAVVLVIGQVAGVDVGTLVEQTRISPVDCPIESLVAGSRHCNCDEKFGRQMRDENTRALSGLVTSV